MALNPEHSFGEADVDSASLISSEMETSPPLLSIALPKSVCLSQLQELIIQESRRQEGLPVIFPVWQGDLGLRLMTDSHGLTNLVMDSQGPRASDIDLIPGFCGIASLNMAFSIGVDGNSQTPFFKPWVMPLLLELQQAGHLTNGGAFQTPDSYPLIVQYLASHREIPLSAFQFDVGQFAEVGLRSFLEFYLGSGNVMLMVYHHVGENNVMDMRHMVIVEGFASNPNNPSETGIMYRDPMDPARPCFLSIPNFIALIDGVDGFKIEPSMLLVRKQSLDL